MSNSIKLQTGCDNESGVQILTPPPSLNIKAKFKIETYKMIQAFMS